MSTPRTLVVGETLVDLFPTDGEPLAAGTGFESRPGGAPANVAVGLASLGHPPWLWTRVGDDPFGDSLKETLEDHGVRSRFVERDPDAPTTLAFVGTGDGGERQFHFHRNATADTRLQPGTVPDSAVETVDWLVLGGVVFSADPARSAAFDLLERARETGCSVLFDPNYRPELWGEHEFAATVERVLENVDVLKATPEEVAAMGCGQGDDQVEAVFDAGPHTLFRTRGSEGALADADERSPWGPGSVERAPPAVDTVDPTGAGDAFVAGVLAAILDGEPSLVGVLETAVKTGAAATTETGAMSALPTRGDAGLE